MLNPGDRVRLNLPGHSWDGFEGTFIRYERGGSLVDWDKGMVKDTPLRNNVIDLIAPVDQSPFANSLRDYIKRELHDV